MRDAESDDQKRRYPALDGLRGFAAISVMVYHLGHWLNLPLLATNSDLAVDLFFCLSGYVLPLAYERYIYRLNFVPFMLIRLIRLMPLIVLGVVVSGLYLTFRNARTGADVPGIALFRAVVLGLFNIPNFSVPAAMGVPQVFPLNGPQYTLFLEVVVNAFWWATRKFDQSIMSITISLTCILLLSFCGLGGDLAGDFWTGFPRVGASFFIGVSLFQFSKNISPQRNLTVPFWILVVLMTVFFYTPFKLPLALSLVWVVILSPALVLTGANIPMRPGLARLCLMAGEMSYPLYCLHYPLFTWINGAYRLKYGPQNIRVEGPLVMVTVFLICFFVLKFYDKPIRRYLMNNLRYLLSPSPAV